MIIFEDLINKEKYIGVVGLGYVGLPIAVHFSKKFKVIGYDVNETKIESYSQGKDLTGDIGDDVLKNADITFTTDIALLKEASFYVVAVPTPITNEKAPDFTFINSSSETIGKCISKGDIVVYESTVYPGVTEDVCVPIIEDVSGLKCGVDFKIGYSPERINPGDKVHTLETIVKIVSGMDNESLKTISKVYNEIIKAGVYEAESIKVAEAAKVIENSQRDINIAFVNEISMILNAMDIDTGAVLNAIATKWNALNFKPGLVGGHCIGIDPYYFIYKAKELGYNSQLISTGRSINDNMGRFVAENIIKKMIHFDKKIKGSNVLILGFTFKENSNDLRNTKVIDIINMLEEFGVNVTVNDPIANKDEASKFYNIDLIDDYKNIKYDSIVLAVNHDVFKEISVDELIDISNGKTLLFDVKGLFNKETIELSNIEYWRL